MNSMKKQPLPPPHREHSHGQGSSINIPKRNYKLLVDPQLKKGQEKLTRFNGETYSCVNHGQRPVVVCDPRAHTTRLWARKEQVNLPVPRYKVDEWYIGAVPPREVTFSKLNDNITKQFMEQMCGKYGKLERVRVYHHPKTDKHMGLAKVVFSSIKSAAVCIERLHQTSIMGNIINAELDSKGELLKRLFNKIVKGEMMADTMPDVIKHTQEKPPPRPSKVHKQRRKSSTDDPRRKSTDSLGRRPSADFHSSVSGPKTPPIETSPIHRTHHTQPQESHSQETDVNQDFVFPPQGHPHPSDDNLSTSIYVPHHKLEEHHERGLPLHLHGVPNMKDFSKPHSLDSEHGSYPGSASIMSEQVSPFCHNQLNDAAEEHNVFVDPMQGTIMEKQTLLHGARDPEHKPKPTLWTKDLQNRIESLISEQNQKYNLDSPKEHVKIERRRSSASETKESSYLAKPSLKIKREKSPQDLEDGECSGEDQPDEEPSTPTSTVLIKKEIISVKTEVKTVSEQHLEKPPSPLPPREFPEKVRPRFSRSPSPSFRFPASHSPPRIPERPGIDHPGFNEQRRFPPPPDDFFHSRRQGFSHERFRHPSPGRPPHDFGDRRFHHEMFDSRSRSPTFDHRRRPVSPFKNHQRHSRSPGYERRHHHPHSPGRGRPPSPGYIRHHDLPPGHPDYGRRRTPSPGFDRRRRSISPPRRFQGPILRREFDCSPRRERMYFSPHDIDRHRRDLSPRYSEHDRHHKRSPGLRHEHHRPMNIPPSPESRKMREHRELPPEFRERWSRQLSSSPPPQGRPRFPADAGHIPHPKAAHIFRRSRSSSPETLNSTPPRIRSPVPMHPDQKPYSPGDLPLDDSANVDGHDPNPVDAKAALRKQRESSDHDAPVISLDERLREITGEPPPEPDSPPESVNEVEEEEEDKPKEVSPTASEDMEISSGGGGSEHGDQPPPVKPHPYSDMPFRSGPGPFRPIYPRPPGQMWRFGGPRGGPDMWNGYNQRFPINQQQPMWRGPLGERPRYSPHLHGRFPQPLHNQNHPEPPFNNQMLPPPPPGWNNRPWVQGQQPPPIDPMFAPGLHEAQQGENEERDSNKIIGDCVLNLVSQNLKETIRKDLSKKVIETMAFKVYESWWDEQRALKNPKPVSGAKPSLNNSNPVIKTEPNSEVQAKIAEINSKPVTQAGKLPALLNTFDPLNWAKGSLEMDGFRIGLGFRSAISKMPSFRVKKRTPSPVPEKKPKLDDNYRKSKADKENQPDVTRKRIWLDSEGEEEDESEQESSEDDEDDRKGLSKTRAVLTVEEVFSSSSSSSEDEATDDEEDEDETDEESDEEQEEEDIEHYPVKKDEVKSSNKRSLVEDEDHVEPPKKKLKAVHDGTSDEKGQPSMEKLDDAVAQAALSLSELQSRALSGSPLLSPSAPAGADLTQESLRHVHPKKRYRLLSKDETRNLDLIAEVSNKLRSDDEVSSMSDKEKAALEILRDMKSTPERIISSANRFSESSDTGEQLRPSVPNRQLSEGGFPHPASSLVSRHSSLEARLPSTPGSGIFTDAKQSGEEELEAVEALLSIKQSQPPIPPLSPPTATLLKKKSSKKRKELENQEPHENEMVKVTHELTQRDRDIMSAIAEEHNYFALSPKDRQAADAADPRLLQILEEHSYSCPPSQAPETTAQRSRRYERERDSLFESGFLKIDGDLSSTSAAERVKLRRESKTEKKTKPKTTKGVHVDDRRKPSYVKHRIRSEMEEMVILYLMWTTGLDVEDMRFLRQEYEDLLTKDNVPKWANDTHWTPHPITNIPDPDSASASSSPLKRNRKRKNKKKNDVSELKAHKSGCARSEGYYKVADKTKLIQRRLMYRHADNTNTGRGYGNTATSSTAASGVATEKSREARHMMRRIAFEFGSDASDLLKYNQLMYRKKAVKFKRSQIHGWGLFAEETIGADEMVIEYVGQLVRSLVADRREVDYTKRGIGSSYLFRIDSDHIIDATKCGNYARFMNHSCDPSCYAKVITVDGAKKIVIYSKNVIRPSDEITYDYKFPIEDVKIPCFCGAINCRGTLN